MELAKRRLGSTGVDVTIMGLGGEGILRTHGHQKEAAELINRAIDLGITYYESARAYAGSEGYYGKALKERRKDIFLASKSHARDSAGAKYHLHETLSAMKTGYLDLWQVHDVRTAADVDEIFGPGGAIEAFAEAKEKGFTRFVGITGHHDPVILRRCIDAFDFDTVLMPVNPAEPAHRSFLADLLPYALEKGMGIIGMKIYLRGFAARLPGVKTLEPFFRFALSHPLSSAVIGCDSADQLEENVRFAQSFNAMAVEEQRDLEKSVSLYARELMYYKP